MFKISVPGFQWDQHALKHRKTKAPKKMALIWTIYGHHDSGKPHEKTEYLFCTSFEYHLRLFFFFFGYCGLEL